MKIKPSTSNNEEPGDYLAWRDKEFAGETVDSIAQKVKAFQEAKEREKQSD